MVTGSTYEEKKLFTYIVPATVCQKVTFQRSVCYDDVFKGKTKACLSKDEGLPDSNMSESALSKCWANQRNRFPTLMQYRLTISGN
jgi:hypothetical protein